MKNSGIFPQKRKRKPESGDEEYQPKNPHFKKKTKTDNKQEKKCPIQKSFIIKDSVLRKWLNQKPQKTSGQKTRNSKKKTNGIEESIIISRRYWPYYQWNDKDKQLLMELVIKHSKNDKISWKEVIRELNDNQIICGVRDCKKFFFAEKNKAKSIQYLEPLPLNNTPENPHLSFLITEEEKNFLEEVDKQPSSIYNKITQLLNPNLGEKVTITHSNFPMEDSYDENAQAIMTLKEVSEEEVTDDEVVETTENSFEDTATQEISWNSFLQL